MRDFGTMLAALHLPPSAVYLSAHSSGSLGLRHVAAPPGGPRREPVGRRLPLRSTCRLGGSLNSLGSDSDDGFDLSLNRELERRTGKYKSLAAHLDLLYNASQAVSGVIGRRARRGPCRVGVLRVGANSAAAGAGALAVSCLPPLGEFLCI